MEISVAWRQFAQRMGVECLVWESCASAVLGGVDRSGSEIAALLLHPAVSCQPQPTPSRTLTGPNTHQPRHLASVLGCALLQSSCHVWDVCSLQSACCMSAAGERNVGRWRAVGRNCTKPIQVSDRCFLPSQASTRPLPGLSSAPAWPPWWRRPQPLSLEGGRRQWWWCVRVEPAVDWDVGRLQCWQWRQCWAAPVYTHTVHSLPVWQAEQPSAQHQHQWQSSAGLPTRTDTKFIKCQVRRKL